MGNAVSVRTATAADLASVLGVLDAAVLETDADTVRTAIEGGDVLVAVAEPAVSSVDHEGIIVGALVLVGDESERIDAIAVRQRRRGQGIGTALVEAAADRRERLVAEFDPEVRPFYESLGFDVEPLDAASLDKAERFRAEWTPSEQ